MEYSALSELLRVTANPKIISLGGGFPAPESFPLKIIKELMTWFLKISRRLSLNMAQPTELKFFGRRLLFGLKIDI